ncbi:MAG: short-chain fatty acid transporter [Phycisphaeraceae bacterium]|nr:short-chain fatty acid transporter [Phycisphaeraceae bacterium]
MLSTLGQRLARVFRATAPDPFVLAILLTALTFLLALAFTDSGGVSTGLYARTLLDAWQGGFWNLLAFAMQMCLILVTGHALASSPPVAALLRRLASLPRTGAQAAAMISFVAICFGLVNWGLGLIVGALLARDASRALREKGITMPAGLLAAAGYTTMMVWHGGLSGSAPLAAASEAQQRAILGEELAARVGAIPVSETIFAPFNLLVTGGLVVIIPALFALLAPRGAAAAASARPEPPVGAPAPIDETDDAPGRFPSMLERSPILVWLIALPALIWLATRFADRGVAALDLNTANLLFLGVGLALHGSARRYADAIDDAARGCAGIILQFPLYAGIIGLMTVSGLAAQISSWFVAQSGGAQGGLSVMTFLSAGLVNLFVPSGGGQWSVQGPIAMQAALDAGVSPARLVLAVSYGDQWTNMLQPFWALPALAITGAKAREVVGYTALALVVGGAWIVGCLLLL